VPGWVNLDRSDDDPRRLVAGVVAALIAHPDGARDAAPAVAAPAPAPTPSAPAMPRPGLS
jgi:hypothetical protein